MLKRIEKIIKEYLLQNKLIYFFYKYKKIYKNKGEGTHFGDFAEDVIINRFFKNLIKGFYCDIGCYHPTKGSLTYLLYKKGWRGLNIDLSKVSIDLFKIARKNDINLNAGISNYNGSSNYYECAPHSAYNSLSKNKGIKKKIEIFTLDYVVNRFDIKNIDFLNIDAENNDYKVLLGINFKKIRPKMICIEDNKSNFSLMTKSKIYKFLKKNYFLFSVCGVSQIYIDKKYKNKMSKILDTRHSINYL
jgi:FkbM family methyltransferase